MTTRLNNMPALPDIVNSRTRMSFSEVEFTAAVGTYLESLVLSENLPVGGDIKDFFPLVKEAITVRQNTEGVPSDKRIFFAEEDPPEVLDTPSITYMLKKRMPGRFDQGPAGEGLVKEVTPHQRSIINHPEHLGEKLVTMGKFYGNWVDFNIYARTNKVAMDLVLWFEQVMDSFSWYFRLNRFRAIELECKAREKVNIDELTLTKYSLSYFIRTEDIYYFSTQELRSLIVEVKVVNE